MNSPITVADLLRNKGTEVWSLSPDCSIREALSIMASKNVGALPVVTRGLIEGIFSERDFARKAADPSFKIDEHCVSGLMTRSVLCVSPRESIEACMALMTQKKIRHLPVVEDGVLSGIISIGDVVNALITAQRENIDYLNTYINGR
ncbi:MAG: CBS domain-containing protein [Candidatus Omnitrophica bacterium]|nr:CBS domain-containing protein [Candidatus Omnitrophota bacterium]